ncbi:MAG: hypothetical protein ABIL58_25155 [Pseudomonadota bacterium]
MMSDAAALRDTVRYLIIVVASFILLQALLVVMHEFTHSTVAWLLGAIRSPLDIVWGNPLTMTGWDEGVDYTRLFEQGRNVAAAVIGVSPLVMHAAVVALGIAALKTDWLLTRKWGFHFLFWFVVANFMELIAYILMRPFASHGDTGLFNRGLSLSPWFLFIIGGSALITGLYMFYRDILPRAERLFASGNRPAQWAILALSAFIIFLWGSGIRVMAYVPGPQRIFGFLGVPVFILLLILFRPKNKTSFGDRFKP